MRCRLFPILTVAFLCLGLGSPPQVGGAEFKLSNGATVRGEISTMNEDGLVVRIPALNTFSDRISWGMLTQETLKELARNSEAAQFVEPFIEIPPSERNKRKEIIIRDVPRADRPSADQTFAAGFSAPGGIFLLAMLFLANIYAGYEIAVFRNRPAALVCGASAILPLLGPILFLLMPAAGYAAAEPPSTHEQPQAEPESGMPRSGPGSTSGLSVTSSSKPEAPAGGYDSTVYNRNDTTFNRRFFETKFTGFFRVVPTEADKDLVLVVKTARMEVVAKRISRISMNEVYLQPLKTGAGEVGVPFAEVVQIHIRHKDART